MNHPKLLPLALLLTLGCQSGAAPTDPTPLPASDRVYTVQHNGIECVAAPCYMFDVRSTEGIGLGSRPASHVDLSDLQLPQPQEEALYRRLFAGELLTVTARLIVVRHDEMPHPSDPDIVVRVTKLLP